MKLNQSLFFFRCHLNFSKGERTEGKFDWYKTNLIKLILINISELLLFINYSALGISPFML